MLNSLQTQKGLELVFKPQFLKNFLMKLFLSEYVKLSEKRLQVSLFQKSSNII